tara:strand:- start:9204 stop:9749 length:546 start_codon:yes stop_codon:yes gene_type:complete
MTFKLVIGHKGKAWKVELDSEVLVGKNIGDKIKGEEIEANLSGYELEITGGTDFAGFAMYKEVEGIGRKRVLLTKGWGMHKRPKGDKKKVPQPDGLRLRKTVVGKMISDKIIQINLKVVREGSKNLDSIFPEQNKKEEEIKEEPKAEEKVEEVPKVEEKPAEEKAEEKVEEKPAEVAAPAA